MKKYIAPVLALLLLCLVGCGDDAPDSVTTATTSISEEATTVGISSAVVPGSDTSISTENTAVSADSSTYIEDELSTTVTIGISETDKAGQKPSANASDTGKETTENRPDEKGTDRIESGEKGTDKNESDKKVTDKKETDKKETTVTTPLIVTLPDGGVELPDDVWE